MSLSSLQCCEVILSGLIASWPTTPIVVPLPLPPETVVSSSVAGRLTGEERVHAVVLQGTTPVLVCEPAAFETSVEMDVGHAVNDIAVLRFEDAVSLDTQDALITVGPAGVHAVQVGPSGQTVDVLENSAPFLNGVAVRVADANDDGRADLAVLAANRRTILVALQDSSGGFTHSATDGVISPVDVHDFDFLNAAGDATKEFAVDNDFGLQIYSLSGGLIDEVRSLRSDLDCMTVLPSTTGGFDQVAWLTAKSRNPAGTMQNLVRWDPSTVTLEGSTALEIVRMSAGDSDGNGERDLICAQHSGENLVVLLGESGEPFSFAPDRVMEFSVSDGSGGASVAVPLVADLSNNGVSDVLYAVQGFSEIQVFDGPLDGDGTMPPSIPGQELFLGDFVHDHTCGTSVGPPFATVYVDAKFQGLSNVHSNSDYLLETKLYKKAFDGLHLPPIPVSHCREPLNTYPLGLAGSDLEDSVEVSFVCDGHDEFVFYFYLRILKTNALGDVVAAGPALLGSFCTDYAARTEIKNTIIWFDWFFELVQDCSGAGQSPASPGLPLNGFTRIRRTPPTPPGMAPNYYLPPTCNP